MPSADTATELRTFPKTWGAEYVAAGEVRFRLWAPGQQEVKLRLDGEDTPMTGAGDGWFEILATGVEPGTPYQYVLDDGLAIADPASRAQKADVHGPSLVIDPTAYPWQETDWRGRPWEEAVIYELHVGTFAEGGTFRSAMERLPHLARLGITAVEIMPVAQFAGNRGWGYDGVLLYAPHSAYGSPEDFKAFVDAAHGLGLMVLLDVVYNHFGPDGNYLPACAPDFFHPDTPTPWGAAIAYDKDPVRRFFIENALYWLEEFNLDGLRFDAIDQIRDESEKHVLVEIAERIRSENPDRHIHLTTEDNRNVTFLHERGKDGTVPLHTGEWNDDFHNVIHVIATGETDAYYQDFEKEPHRHLARVLAEGFAHQGDVAPSTGEKRGSPSTHQPPTAFVDFIQNHDQVGNRAFGERLLTLAGQDRVEALLAVLLLSPHIPLMFMGEEMGEERPFLFFTDFHGDLAKAVREGRRKEFTGHAGFRAGEGDTSEIPDPNAEKTFTACKLDWNRLESETGRQWTAFVERLLTLRRGNIVPLLAGARGHAGNIAAVEGGMIAVSWTLGGATLSMAANLSDSPAKRPNLPGNILYETTGTRDGKSADDGDLPPWSVVVAIDAAEGRK
ncbi:malto-oligosyltrehalose trehalohydrolase [Neorhizobium sp. NPDC001467]|uniref:malto-oligosyltrehalose trehalohydrolase n=1 Tax=Neorhizobium sp. NPDC001467 TaxID=3390595 RepID=UPI003CFF9B88